MVVLLALRAAAPASVRAQPGETLKFRRLTLRSATGLPQRGKPHHEFFVNDMIPSPLQIIEPNAAGLRLFI
jgi:hypothetical protein